MDKETKISDSLNSVGGNRAKGMVLLYLYKYFNILIILSAIIVLLLGFYFVIEPKRMSIAGSLDIANQERQKSKEDLGNLITAINKYKSSFDKIGKADKDKMNAMIPAKLKKEELFVQFEKMIKHSGLILSGLAIKESVKKDSTNVRAAKTADRADVTLPQNIGAAVLSADISGTDYQAFINFLKTLEDSLPLMNVKKLSFSSSGESLKIEIETYYLK
jgi:hypothetical protein